MKILKFENIEEVFSKELFNEDLDVQMSAPSRKFDDGPSIKFDTGPSRKFDGSVASRKFDGIIESIELISSEKGRLIMKEEGAIVNFDIEKQKTSVKKTK